MDYKGRLEICINRMWGTVCSKHDSYYYGPSLWERNAKVVCRQIGHQDLGMPSFSVLISLNCSPVISLVFSVTLLNYS